MRKGIMLDATGDIAIVNGSMVIGHTDVQNQKILLFAHKGEIKATPTLGVGIEDIVNDDDLLFWKREISTELAKDGIRTIDVSLSNSSIHITT